MNRSRRKPISCSAVSSSSLSGFAHCATLLPFLFPFPLFLFFFPHFSSLFFFSFLISFSLLSSLFLFLSYSPLLLRTSPFILASICMHFDTWLAMCHSHGLPCVLPAFACMLTYGLPCVTHMTCHVSLDTRCIQKREIPTISKFNEIRLSN